MIIYFASERHFLGQLLEHKVKNILVSYYELQRGMNGLDMVRKYPANYFLDSGAYSAFHVNATIDLNAYMKYIKDTASLWKIYACLDTIGQPKATLATQERMEKEGLHPLPVFHVNSPLPMLHDICKKYDYFALGGLVPYARQRKKVQTWCDTCFSVIKEYWPKKVHGFGINSSYVVERYPWYSVDSTTYTGGNRWGQVLEYKMGRILSITRETNPYHIVRYGTWKHRSPAFTDRMLQQNIETTLKLQKRITELWAQKGVVWTN